MRTQLILIVARRFSLLICAALILFVSWGLLTSDPFAVVRRSPFSVLTTVSDLIMHCGAYAVITAVCLATTCRNTERSGQFAMKTFLVAHAIVTELLQAWIPNRTCDPLDALANLAGIALGAAAISWLTRPAQRTAAQV